MVIEIHIWSFFVQTKNGVFGNDATQNRERKLSNIKKCALNKWFRKLFELWDHEQYEIFSILKE